MALEYISEEDRSENVFGHPHFGKAIVCSLRFALRDRDVLQS